jgi:hypothetical protein
MPHPSWVVLCIAARACCLVAVLVASLVLGAGHPTHTAAQEATPTGEISISPLAAASSWLRAQQGADGGFIGFSGEPDAATTTDAAMALYAAVVSDPEADAALAAAIAYLDQHGAGYAATGPGQAAKLALAAVTGGRDPRSFAGVDLVAAMTTPLATPIPDAVAGMYGDDLYDHALVIIALVAAGEPVPDAALEPLRATQGADGGWAFDGSTDPGAADSNTTALVIQALAAAGRAPDPMVDAALAFLHTLQVPDGSGFAYGPADPPLADTNSTALVTQALIATGEDPSAPEWGSPALALAAFQLPSGGFRYMAADEGPNLLATVQAMPALAGMPLPVAKGCGETGSAASGECLALAPAA